MPIGFSNISRKGLIGRLARAPLALIPKGAVMPIMQGPLKGRKWIAGSHVHGCWLGSYELDKQLLFARTIKPNDVIFDIGANVGFYTLLSSLLAGPGGKVFAFEPSPRNQTLLARHIKINRLDNVTVFPVAVADHEGEAMFDFGSNPAQGKVSNSGSLKVRLVALDDLFASGQTSRPTLMKIDVEGAEGMVLRGARNLITSGPRPTIFLATHGKEVHAECLSILKDYGYEVAAAEGGDVNATDELIATPA